MSAPVKRFQSKDGTVRIDVIKREDHLLMFVEDTLYSEDGKTFWAPTYQSGLYESQAIAEREAESRLNSRTYDVVGSKATLSRQANSQSTGYFVDAKKQIIGPEGPTGLYLDENEYLLDNGQNTGVYIEDGHFFKIGRRILWLFSVSSPTGHVINSDGLIIGNPWKLPWQSD